MTPQHLTTFVYLFASHGVLPQNAQQQCNKHVNNVIQMFTQVTLFAIQYIAMFIIYVLYIYTSEVT